MGIIVFMTILKNNIRTVEKVLVICAICIAWFIRILNIDQYAIFLSDQAIDSFAVKNILSGDFTLLGPRASVGQFFNGPIVYYLMAPFYLIFSNDPLAGTIFQITLQIACMPFLYGIAKRFGGVRAGLISLLIFTFSPLLIYYSRATFNAYPAIFFTTLIAYVLTSDRPGRYSYLIAGFCTGMVVQMHYFLYVYACMYLVFIVYREWGAHAHARWNQTIRLMNLLYFLIGGVIGLAPFLLFEIRHSFFNLHSILTSGSAIGQSIDIWGRIGSVGVAITSIFGFSSGIVGLLILGCLSMTLVLMRADNRLKMMYVFTLGALIVCAVVYRGLMHSHYTIGFTIMCIIAISYVVARIVSSRLLAIAALLYCIALFITAMTSGTFAVSKEHDGFGLQDQRKTVAYIIQWKTQSRSKLTYNVTQDAQQDNRAMPLRYFLSLDKSVMQPLPVEEYGSNIELFLIVKRGVDPSKIRTWEVRSFGNKYIIVKRSNINDSYELLYLRKAI